MTGFQGLSHDLDISCSVKGEVATAVRHLDQLVDNGLSLGQLLGVNKVGYAVSVRYFRGTTCRLTGSELQGGLLLAIVHVDSDDFGALLGPSSLKNGETDASDTENGDVRVFWKPRIISRLRILRLRATDRFRESW